MLILTTPYENAMYHNQLCTLYACENDDNSGQPLRLYANAFSFLSSLIPQCLASLSRLLMADIVCRYLLPLCTVCYMYWRFGWHLLMYTSEGGSFIQL